MKHQLVVTWQHMRRSPYQAAAAVMIMVLTTSVGLVFFLLSLGSQKLLTYLEQKPQVIAFFNDTVTREDQIKETANKLHETNKAVSIEFVSKEQALQIYKERNKSDPLLLELVSANTLPASLEVSAKNVADLPVLYEILKQAPNVEDISYQKDVVNTLIGVLDKIRKGGLGLVIFLVLTSLFTILTIIGLKIALRKDEIEVEKLVGASGNYIRLPFLLEGFLYGVFGAVISWTILFGGIYLATPYILPYISGLNLLPLSFVFALEVFGGAILAGGLVGVIGSFLAVWRYLKN
ncbi:ABC transporter permease [Candidatus Gottesmanbacteria bacterium]|nr:ABC transporter permease [Candidatus Gottesmanbacteria bacterium]